jgi:hypothetical protein
MQNLFLFFNIGCPKCMPNKLITARLLVVRTCARVLNFLSFPVITLWCLLRMLIRAAFVVFIDLEQLQYQWRSCDFGAQNKI